MARIAAADVEAIERATVAAVSPGSVAELDGWLLPFDAGTIGRAKSAVPLNHEEADPALIATIEARYRAEALGALFRLADDSRLEPLRVELHRRNYRPEKPTRVQTAAAAAVKRIASGGLAQVAPSPDDAWASVFTSEGFDASDGATRVRAFARTADAAYASVRENGRTVAVGVGAFGFGWASVHGMRTLRSHRGRGLAGRVLAALAEAALRRGIDRMFLQVEEGNAAAQSLYRRAGFRTAWRYVYWRSGQ